MDAIKKVLVVDDDPVVGKSFDRVLTGKGYAVITASNGDEALSKLRSENYDVVFTDIRMPGMSGLEVAERVRESQPWLPVVIITGYGTDANEAQAKQAGVSSFLRKPLSPEMIEGSAREALLKTATVAVPAEIAVVQPATPAQVAVPAAPAPEAKPAGFVKNVALFIAAPFIGLAYMIAMPFIGLGMLALMGGRKMMENRVVRKIAVGVKTTVMIIAAPLLGLAYIVALPFIGLAMLGWMGVKALVKRS